MGILNITPDSFSDGGLYTSIDAAVKHVASMIEEGADCIDIGCESSRPGATPISLQEELDRLLPILDAIQSRFNIPLSIDTYKPDVMHWAIEKKVFMINDILALTTPGAVDVVKDSDVQLCIMHHRGTPETLHDDKNYINVIDEVFGFLKNRVDHLVASGIAADRIIIDPGFGFAKESQHNLDLLKNIAVLKKLECPILIGISRKRMFGQWFDRQTIERLPACLSASLWAYAQGVQWFRTHDVKATSDALKMHQLLIGA